MSPEEIRAAVVLRRVRTEVEVDHATLVDLFEELKATVRDRGEEPYERVWLVYLATLVHAYYTALETLLTRIVRDLDHEVPSGERWHRELLWQSMLEVPEKRPAVIPRSLHRDLEALLRFRHFFRHAYGLQLDPAKVKEVIDRVLEVHEVLDRSLSSFERFLEEAEAELRDS